MGVAEIPLPQFLAAEVAVFFIAAGRPRATGVVAVLLALAVLAGYLAVRLMCGWPITTSSETAVALTTVIAWLLGNSVRESREHAEELRVRAATQAVTDERLRIARELHDMVAHSIGVIALQAGAARRVIDTQPERARDALGEIETAGRQTLSGLRRMLGGLRGPEQGRTAPPVPPEPAPMEPGHPKPGHPEPGHRESGLGLADLDRLAATITQAGVRVDVRRSGSLVHCRRRSTCRPTASSRRPSPTWCVTPARHRAGCRSATGTTRCASRSSTTGAAVTPKEVTA
ncbi:hypothetical protein GCM10027612_37080 [Microbispora bryophytorum subsp. camponoti]